MPNGNGHEARTMELQHSELPPTREAVVEQGLRIQQETAAERDMLRREVSGLRNDITGYKVAIEALQAQLAEADSRVASSTLVRDEAVGRRAELETVLRTIMSVLRTFQIQHEPLITGTNDDQTAASRDRRLDMAGSDRFDNRGDVG